MSPLLSRTRLRENDGLLLIEGAGGVMTPIDDTHTGLDLMARLGHPVILVTGSYLGALSHTLTALAAIRGRGIVVEAGSSSPNRKTTWDLTDTVESLRQFAGADVPVFALPRLAGKRRREMARRTLPDGSLRRSRMLEIVRKTTEIGVTSCTTTGMNMVFLTSGSLTARCRSPRRRCRSCGRTAAASCWPTAAS